MFANPVFITPGRSTYPIILERKFSYIKTKLIENCKKNYKLTCSEQKIANVSFVNECHKIDTSPDEKN